MIAISKRKIDNEKAQEERLQVLSFLQTILSKSTFWVEYDPGLKRNHSFVLRNTKYDHFRYIDIRFDNGGGVYSKDDEPLACFENLKEKNPIFIIVLKNDKDEITHLTVFTMEDPVMNNKGNWLVGGDGNRNRLQNVKLGYDLRKYTQYSISEEGGLLFGTGMEDFIKHLERIF